MDSLAIMYFAKVNINSEVYNLYKDPSLQDKILDKLLVNINQKKRVEIVEKKEKFWIKFITLEKDIDKRYISGRVVKIFEDDINMYDVEKDDIAQLPTKELARSVTFYFDLRTEYVAFSTSRFFGYKQFSAYFTQLLNAYSEDVEFEVFLEKNADKLKEKIYQMKKILQIDITIIPPNPNEGALMRMFPQDAAEIEAGRITKIQQTYSASAKSDGINPKTDLITRAIEGISDGYGEMSATGRGADGGRHYVTSEQHAPHRRWIHDNIKDSISGIMDAGRAYIQELIQKRLG